MARGIKEHLAAEDKRNQPIAIRLSTKEREQISDYLSKNNYDKGLSTFIREVLLKAIKQALTLRIERYKKKS